LPLVLSTTCVMMTMRGRMPATVGARQQWLSSQATVGLHRYHDNRTCAVFSPWCYPLGCVDSRPYVSGTDPQRSCATLSQRVERLVRIQAIS
jgi:hypothetical protein